MSAEQRAFLGAILESPDDDTPRLIFADWLSETGNPHRAEFIRCQCALARMGRKPGGMGNVWEAAAQWEDVHTDLRARESEAWMDGRLSWGIGFPGCVGDALNNIDWWHRGFLARVRLKVDDVLAHGPALCRMTPLEKIVVTDRSPQPRIRSDAPDWLWSPMRRKSPDHGSYDCWYLPRELWDFIGTEAFPSRQTAMDALSEAALRWCKSEAAKEAVL